MQAGISNGLVIVGRQRSQSGEDLSSVGDGSLRLAIFGLSSSWT